MTIEIKAPTFPESVQEGTIAAWHKQQGDSVSRDELLVDIETDKVVLEVVAPADGVLSEVLKPEGADVLSNEVIAIVTPGEAASADVEKPRDQNPEPEQADASPASPSARKLAEEEGIDLARVTGSGRDGRITKEDVEAFRTAQSASTKVGGGVPSEVAADSAEHTPPVETVSAGNRVEKRVPMTRMRMRISERLLQVTQNTAMLTTFNEVDMHRVMNLRRQFKDEFASVHNGTRLGFMGIFVRAACEALKRFPAVNASIDGSDIVYHAYQDIGVAVSTDKGLVVPVLRNADQMTIADIECKVAEYGSRAREGKLTIEEMTGGTFTITNGGVFGSLLSTPILNPPQTAILGMHKIQDRPVVENGEIVVRPMMYLALSYDHRLIDGKEAVQFLVSIKEMIENPAKILLEI